LLKHVLSDEAVRRPFDPQEAIQTECMITTYQNLYYYANSFLEAKEQLRFVAFYNLLDLQCDCIPAFKPSLHLLTVSPNSQPVS
jgi:phenylalanine-4-hydroxylase